MKKYRIQKSLELLNRVIEAIEAIDERNKLEDNLRLLTRANQLTLIIHNTMRSLHD